MKANILIVDDMDSNRILLEAVVNSMEHIPTLAENGLIAMERMEEQPPDLVLLDIFMPEMDGHEVLKSMKSSDALRHIPVIVISAHDDIDNVITCIKEGADGYITKPFDHTLLKARIIAYIDKKKMHDQEKKLFAELAEKHETLQKAEQARDAMTHMIVHDLKNILMVIMGNLEIMDMDMASNSLDNKRLEGYLKTLGSAGREMSSFITSILGVSRLESGDMPISLTSVNALQMLEKLYDQYTIIANNKKVRLSLKPASTDIIIKADKTILSRILQNLLNNALKHTPEETDVTMSVERDGNNIVFYIEDNGPGIPEEYRERIFDKFFQIKNENESSAMGAGLGLTFCKMATEAQGGKISIESREAKGSCFKVQLQAATG